jgi:predicted Rossmann fold nucleotide-binding protein DprA/Smf involved in DNA uptake
MALCFISGLGPKTILKILRFYPRLENFEAALKNKQLNPKLGALTIEKIKTDLDISKAEKIINYCQLEKINILTYRDENYPYLLKQIFDPPIILFCAAIKVVSVTKFSCRRRHQKNFSLRPTNYARTTSAPFLPKNYYCFRTGPRR